MNEIEQWRENSSQYLAAALAWLRLRLMRLAQSAQRQVPDMVAGKDQGSCWFFGRKKSREASAPVPDKVTNEMIAEAERAMAEAAQVEPAPPFVILSRRFGLTPFEMEILLLCAAMELDTRIPALCARAQYPGEKAYPTFALAFTLFDDPAWDAVSAERPLRYWRLIEIHQPATTPLTQSALRADERIVNYLKGLNQLDDRLIPFLAPFEVYDDEEARLASSHQNIAKAVESSIRAMATDGRPPVIQLTGIDPVSKQHVAVEVLSRLGLQGYRMPGELLPSQPAEIENLARLWHRESVLLPLALYIESHDSQESGQPVDHLQLSRFLARCGTLTFLDTREPRTGVGLNSPAFDIDKPLAVEQQAAWREALGPESEGAPEQLSAQFNLNLPAIRQIARIVLAESHPDETGLPLSDRIWQACLSRTRPRLDRLAQRIEPKADWDALILPDETLNLLRAITDQVKQRSKVYDEWGFRRKMSRGFGISALFGGESGTGKTMAAEVIANDLCLDL